MEKARLVLPDGRLVVVGDKVNDKIITNFSTEQLFYKDRCGVERSFHIHNIESIQHLHEWTNALGEQEKIWDGDKVYIYNSIIYPTIENFIYCECSKLSERCFTSRESAQKYIDSLKKPKWKVKPEDFPYTSVGMSDNNLTNVQNDSVHAHLKLLWAMNKINEGTQWGDRKWLLLQKFNIHTQPFYILVIHKNENIFLSKFVFPDKERAEYFCETFKNELNKFYMID